MEEEFHPLVKLLLARMVSHPEEFEGINANDHHGANDPDEWRKWRWEPIVRDMREHLTEAEDKAIGEAMRGIHMERLHHKAMDELFNGEERRRVEREKHEADMKTYTLQKAQAQAYTQNQLGSYQNALTAAGSYPSILGTEPEPQGILGAIKRGLGR